MIRGPTDHYLKSITATVVSKAKSVGLDAGVINRITQMLQSGADQLHV